MRKIVALGMLLSIVAVGQTAAQTCGAASTAAMTSAQINALVSGKYACVGTSPNAEWNELHDSSSGSGNVLDYKKGPKDPLDPSATPSHPSGTFVISPSGGNGQIGLITYTYGTTSYGYNVVDSNTAPIYSFCGASAGTLNLSVTISATHC